MVPPGSERSSGDEAVNGNTDSEILSPNRGRPLRNALRPGVVRIVFWNRHHFSGAARTFGYLDALVAGWDVALLVECQEHIADAAVSRYGPKQVASVFEHYEDDESDKPHGPVVVVRNGVSVVHSRLTIPDGDGVEEPKPDKSLTVELSTPWGPLTVLATHVMPGADSWTRKLATYRSLVEVLGPESQPWPVVIGLDGNNSGDWLEPDDAGTPPEGNGFDQWVFHAPDPPHGLVDTLRAAIQADPERAEAAQLRLEDSDVLVGTRPRSYDIDRMDRIYASPDLTVVDAGVDPASREFSDHALVWADLMFAPPRQTADPEMTPTGPRGSPASRERSSADTIEEAVAAVVDGYGWNRRGYVARVALGVLTSTGGRASQSFIDDHYPGVAQPARKWSITRTLCNKGWTSVGGGAFCEEFIDFDATTRTHSMRSDVAEAVLETLGIKDLRMHVDAPDLEEQLAEHIDPRRSEE